VHFLTKNMTGFGSKILAGVGAVAIIALILWGAVNVARLVPSAFSNLATAAITLTSVFQPGGGSLELTLEDSIVDSGVPFTLSWEYSPKEDGYYAFSYGCKDGFGVAVLTEDGEYVENTCETPTRIFTTSDNSARVVATSENNRFIDVPIALAYITDGDVITTDERTITIVNEDITNSRSSIDDDNTDGTSGSGTGTGTTGGGTGVTKGDFTETLFEITPGSNPVDPNGRPDLFPSITSMGIIDIDTNQFTATSSASIHDRVAVQFTVENIGTAASGPWNFVAVLPARKIEFFSPNVTQRSLAPGDRIEYTIGFDGVKTAEEVEIRINVNSAPNDSNTANNITGGKILIFTEDINAE